MCPWPSMTPSHNKKDRTGTIREHLDRIEAEMRRLGIWDVPDPGPDALKNGGAFGMNTMSFEQWLRWVFVPRVRKLLETGGPWPTSSDVGIAAMRNFDGQDESSGLVTMLCEFDALFTEE